MKRIRIFAMVVFAVTFFSCFATAETLYVCTNGGDLNGRAKPSIKSSVEMKIPDGEAVEAVSYDGGWVEIVGGETGTVWCKAEYLSSTQEATKYRNTSGGRVFVRDGIEGAKTGLVVRANGIVAVTRQINGWGYIGEGWVNLKYFDQQ